MNHFYATRRTILFIAFSLSLVSFSFGAVFTVTNTNPTGPGSLDQAIIDANANAGPDAIVFAIAGPPPYVITPGFPGLTPITDTVTINGYTQPGASQGPIGTRVILVSINGALAGNSNGLTIDANDVTIAGLNINSFIGNGISVPNGADSLFIWGNFIGSDITGFNDAGNGRSGIALVNATEDGPGGSDMVVIGTNSDGTADTDEGNLISGNGLDGIFGWTLTNSIISGNFIGSDRTAVGTTLGNGRNGILLTVASNSNRIGTNGDNTNDTQELNGIIRNAAAGISIAANSNDNIISGNIVGLDINGAAAGNTGNGIEIINSSNNRVGLDENDADFNAERNVVSSNGGNGIAIIGQDFFGNFDPAISNIIAGNYVGTTPTDDPRGNGGNGIALGSANGVTNGFNLIGSNGDGILDNQEGNVIAYNSVFGIATSNTPDVTGDIFSINSIYNNSSLGIDLGGNGVTANDNGDADPGPNEYFNFPVITSTYGNGTDLFVSGISGTNTVIEVYVDDGSGEGRTFLFRAQEGSTMNGITDTLAGTGSYSDPTYGTFTDQLFAFRVPLLSIPVTFTPGMRLVALGIDPGSGSTSEFGPSVLLLPITLNGFKGQLDNGIVKLNWSTSFEARSSHFEVEKSLDGINYTAIGRVNARGVAGQYNFTDITPLGKNNYYRLRQVDADGHATYSKVLIIRNDGEALTVRITPNPVSSYLNVSFKLEKAEVVKLNFYDQMGRLAKRYVLQGSKGINAFTISDLGNLPAGNYVVELIGETVSAKQQMMKK
jgi:hypothetical protein